VESADLPLKVVGPSQSIEDRLGSGEQSFVVEQFPPFSIFEEVALLSNRCKRECGIQLNLKDSQPKAATFYSIGNELDIRAPEGLYDSIKVFFHTHWVKEDRLPESVISMTPSFIPGRFNQFLIGDYGNNTDGRIGGGYLNTINPLGVTFITSLEKHTRIAKITSKFRAKSGTADLVSAPIIIIKSGASEGELIDAFTDDVKMTDHLGKSNELAFTVRVPDNNFDYNMLFVRHNYLQESKITPEDICFRDGLNRLITSLGSNIPHQMNVFYAMLRPLKWATI
jgi:hypothetical protein